MYINKDLKKKEKCVSLKRDTAKTWNLWLDQQVSIGPNYGLHAS